MVPAATWMLLHPPKPAPAPAPVDKVDLPENIAALELAMDVGDWLLGMGSPSADVVTIMLDITRRYCPRRVHVDIASTAITLSQGRVGREPLTMFRTATPRALNHSTLQAIRVCVAGFGPDVSVEEARERFDAVIEGVRAYPWWGFMLSSAMVGVGAATLFAPRPRTLLLTFLVGCLAERLLSFLGRRGTPAFFGQIAAALAITLSAAGLATLSHLGWRFFPPLNPTVIVVGGIVMLLVGFMFVSAVQDAIDAFYVTASGRLLQVAMLTSGIVIGILVGMYCSKQLHLGVFISANPLTMAAPGWQLVGAGLIAGAFAAYCQSTRQAVIWSTLVGVATWAIFLLVQRYGGLSDVPASFVAATAAGLLGTLISTRLRMSDMAVTQAGIVMLVPGLRLYNGLMQVVNYPVDDPRFLSGVSGLMVALAVGVAIAAGSSLGTLVGRPIRRQLRLMRNATTSAHDHVPGAKPARQSGEPGPTMPRKPEPQPENDEIAEVAQGVVAPVPPA